MGRIRTIKPDFFKHEDLFDAEQEMGLPLRLAFAGLWTCCDREGRFEWRPRSLKTDVLPYDEIDFSRVLDSLAMRHFIVKYRVGSKEYGFVPGFSRHQVVNNREKSSILPEPPVNPQVTDLKEETTCDARVNDASATRHGNAHGEGEVEGEGKGKGNIAAAARARGADGDLPKDGSPEKSDDASFRERLLVAIGHDSSGVTANGKIVGGQAEFASLKKAMDDLRLSEHDALAVAHDIAKRRATQDQGPPSSLKYLIPSMQEFAGARSGATVTPTAPAPKPEWQMTQAEKERERKMRFYRSVSARHDAKFGG